MLSLKRRPSSGHCRALPLARQHSPRVACLCHACISYRPSLYSEIPNSFTESSGCPQSRVAEREHFDPEPHLYCQTPILRPSFSALGIGRWRDGRLGSSCTNIKGFVWILNGNVHSEDGASSADSQSTNHCPTIALLYSMCIRRAYVVV